MTAGCSPASLKLSLLCPSSNTGLLFQIYRPSAGRTGPKTHLIVLTVLLSCHCPAGLTSPLSTRRVDGKRERESKSRQGSCVLDSPRVTSTANPCWHDAVGEEQQAAWAAMLPTIPGNPPQMRASSERVVEGMTPKRSIHGLRWTGSRSQWHWEDGLPGTSSCCDRTGRQTDRQGRRLSCPSRQQCATELRAGAAFSRPQGWVVRTLAAANQDPEVHRDILGPGLLLKVVSCSGLPQQVPCPMSRRRSAMPAARSKLQKSGTIPSWGFGEKCGESRSEKKLLEIVKG